MLKIKRVLTEDNRIGTVRLSNKHDGLGIFDLYKGNGDDSTNYYATIHGNPETIVMAITSDLYDQIFG